MNQNILTWNLIIDKIIMFIIDPLQRNIYYIELYFANYLITLVIKILVNLLLKCGNQNGQNQKIQVEEYKTIGYQIK